jgi:hypothetical protein
VDQSRDHNPRSSFRLILRPRNRRNTHSKVAVLGSRSSHKAWLRLRAPFAIVVKSIQSCPMAKFWQPRSLPSKSRLFGCFIRTILSMASQARAAECLCYTCWMSDMQQIPESCLLADMGGHWCIYAVGDRVGSISIGRHYNSPHVTALLLFRDVSYRLLKYASR